ncbi:NADP-dependent isocitrate dehydrogenase [Arcanobacterium phocisimile]|uniref:Isocitrate dehydrogenase [NADP] n=1 Tax=Arcanobacterium phocisimile TaxID=1302235 RepID=A0ABX7IFI8_9ACTO|nr:NADP-dependent isocitrate dehydrogenase [Arcanobacterium phocisimile]QRV01893.1 NADP-dependent isocitrate dehydrogenase [Arcanobacterium phocisimile]
MVEIIYTHTDEAPMLASASLLPIISSFTATAGIKVTSYDISLAGRMIAAFSDQLPPHMQQPDALTELGKLAQKPEANIVKLPNISASLPQLLAAIKELQDHGYPLPDYPTQPTTAADRDIRRRYDAIIGSAVNPVLREGNSDRRAPQAVKNYARSHPHHMATWSADSQTFVATMHSGDFKHNEVSTVVEKLCHAKIIFTALDGSSQTITPHITLDAGDVVDASVMDVNALDTFLTDCVAAAKTHDLLFSLHLKATMMKVSDPVIFGRAVRAFFPRTFQQFGAVLHASGLYADNGLGSIFTGLENAPDLRSVAPAIKDSFAAELSAGPQLAMVNSDQGITNLHVPSDVIVDASMPAMIRSGGKMWGADGQLHDTVAVIPDSSYADVYQVVIDDCKAHGAYDPVTMGSVPNVGLMAQKAEEYGSHDKTFVAPDAGRVELIDDNGKVLLTRDVHDGDIFRSCVTKDEPIRNWVGLAVERARISQTPVIFWLDPQRAHDRIMAEKVTHYLTEHDTHGLDIQILSPRRATEVTVERIRYGLDTISATGNVLRDYLTDLFPIMELGTSAKMLSVVPLMAGGGLFETGAGGSAPKLARQLLEENHLRWDSLGEFLAIAESLRHAGRTTGNSRALVLADTLDQATERVLSEERSAQAGVGQPDNRSSHVWLATYWAGALANQNNDPELAHVFTPLAQQLEDHSGEIQDELITAQGKPISLGGYYQPDPEVLESTMRPCTQFNDILATL